MYDYIKDFSRGLTSEQLIDVFSNIAILNEQVLCKNWVELIGAVGVTGMLDLAATLGGKTFRIPTLYEILMVYAAMTVVERAKTSSIEEAKKEVIGTLTLEGFDELVDRIRDLTAGIISKSED